MRTILEVEDDPNDVFLLQHAMNKMGVANSIQVATDGQQAIDTARRRRFADREQFPLPSIVLLDLKLPYVMGLDVLKWIRQQPGTPVPVIMLTASSEEGDITAAYSLGANAFLTKPSEANKLENMVKAIKDFWLTHNTLPRESVPESPMEGVVSLGCSLQADFAAKPSHPMNGTPREEWPRNTRMTL
jgi:two-component system response regulator